MFRILLIIVVIAIGYDAVVHSGHYTRQIWTGVVGLTDSAVGSAKQLGEKVRDETATKTN